MPTSRNTRKSQESNDSNKIIGAKRIKYTSLLRRKTRVLDSSQHDALAIAENDCALYDPEVPSQTVTPIMSSRKAIVSPKFVYDNSSIHTKLQRKTKVQFANRLVASQPQCPSAIEMVFDSKYSLDMIQQLIGEESESLPPSISQERWIDTLGTHSTMRG